MSLSRSLIAVLIALTAATVELASDPPAAPGSSAPAFALAGSATTGGPTLPTLLVFLDFEEARAPATGPSDSEAAALLSFSGRPGLGPVRVLLVDASGTVDDRPIALEDLAERLRAWGLGRFPVIQDHDEAGLARSYRVKRLPAIFLIDERWIIRNRWDRLVGTAELANAVAALPAPR